jgi:hypothetical protein
MPPAPVEFALPILTPDPAPGAGSFASRRSHTADAAASFAGEPAGPIRRAPPSSVSGPAEAARASQTGAPSPTQGRRSERLHP